MEIETLKAKLMATSQLSSVLDSTARSADSVADELQNSAVAGELLASGMDSAQDEANVLQRALSQANREAVEGAAAANVYAEGLDETAGSAAEAAAASAMAKQQIEDVGEESLRAAAKTEALDQSLDDVDGPGVRANLLGISGGLGTVAAAAAAATPAILGLTAAVGGLGTIGAGAAVGGLGLTAAGIQSRAEEMAAFSDELETAADAREQLMSNFIGELESATDVLQTSASEQFAMDNLEAVVDIAESGANALAAVQPTIFGLAGGLREVAVATSPEIFGALGSEVEDLAPLLSELDGVVRDVPGLITYLGNAAERVGPDLFALGAAATDVLGPITSFGLATSDVLLPPLNATLFVVGGLLGLFDLLPVSAQNAAVAFTAAAGGAYLLSGAMGVLSGSTFAATLATKGLIAAIGTLTLPISGTAAAIAALIGLSAGLASHFGLLDGAASAVTGTWNGLVESAEWVVNLLSAIKPAINAVGIAIATVNPALGGTILLLNNLGAVVDVVKGGLSALGDLIKSIGKGAEKYLGWVPGLIEDIDQSVAEAGGDVDFSAAKVGGNNRDEDGSGSGGGDNSGGNGGGFSGRSPPPAAPAATTGGSGSTTVDMSEATFVGSNESEMKQWVREAVEEANSSTQQRQDAQGI